jgi:hypothetical protein
MAMLSRISWRKSRCVRCSVSGVLEGDWESILEVFMAASYTAVIQQHGEWWIGWIEEVPGVSSQGQSREELLENLRCPRRGAGDESRRGAGRCERRLPGSEHSGVKRHELLCAPAPGRLRLAPRGPAASWRANPANGRRSAVPRHSEIPDLLCRNICRDLGISPPSDR